MFKWFTLTGEICFRILIGVKAEPFPLKEDTKTFKNELASEESNFILWIFTYHLPHNRKINMVDHTERKEWKDKAGNKEKKLASQKKEQHRLIENYYLFLQTNVEI